MKKLAVLSCALAAIFALAPALAPASAAPGGALDTLRLGYYECEMPGDATGPIGIRVPQADFTITNASAYRSATGAGTYLLTGERIVMTSGPLNGTEYRQVSTVLLRLVQDGKDARQRCILQVAKKAR